MRQEDIWDHEAAQRYDTPGTGMSAPRGSSGRLWTGSLNSPVTAAQEFAIGAGRVAIPWLGAACLSRASSYPVR